MVKGEVISILTDKGTILGTAQSSLGHIGFKQELFSSERLAIPWDQPSDENDFPVYKYALLDSPTSKVIMFWQQPQLPGVTGVI